MKLKLLYITLSLGCFSALAQQVPPPTPPEIPTPESIPLPPEPEVVSPPEEVTPAESVDDGAAAELTSLPGAPDLPPPPPPPQPEATTTDTVAGGVPGVDGTAPNEDGTTPIEQADGGFLIRDAALNDIFQLLARRAGKQYFHNPSIAGPEFNVSGHLNDGDPLEQMEALAFNARLTLYTKGETVYAMNREQLSQLPAKEWHYQLNYLRPTDIDQIKALVTPLLSPGTGLVNFEPKTNTLIVIDSAHAIEGIESLITSVDKPKGQITIEVKILSVNSTVGENLGVDWAFNLEDTGIALNGDLNSIFGFGGLSGSVTDSIVLSPPQIGGVLTALSRGGLVTSTQNPTLITEDNEEATISLIDRVPIITQTTTASASTTNISEEVRYTIDESDPVGDPATSREIGVTMAVTPTLLPDGTIRMKMRPRSAQIVEDVVSAGTGNVYPRVSESMIQTIARVPDGHSLLVGGFYGQTKDKTDTKVPGLGDVPVLNFFFKDKTTSKETASLVFVVTPTSYNPASSSDSIYTASRLRDRLSVDEGYDWIDPTLPGRAHVPNLNRTLRQANPARPVPRPSVESFQPTLEPVDPPRSKRPHRSGPRYRRSK